MTIVGQLCLLMAAGSPLSAATSFADVRAFGAQGDGRVDDSAAFTKAISAVSVQGGGLVLVPPGNYLVPGTYGHRVVLRSQITLQFAPGASLVVGQPAENHYPLYLSSSSGPLTNVVVEHATLIGDPANTNASAGVFIRALGTNLLRNIVLRDLTIRGFSTDGLYIDGTTNNAPVDVRLERVTARENRRHGLALICVDGFRASSCVFERHQGYAYSCGVDVEPNLNQRVKDVAFIECAFRENRAQGLWFNRGGGLAMEQVSAVNCLAQRNGGAGFQANEATEVLLRDVQAQANTNQGVSICEGARTRIQRGRSTGNGGCGLLLIAPHGLKVNGFESSSNLLHGLHVTRGRPLASPFDVSVTPLMVGESMFRANGKAGIHNSGVPNAMFVSNRIELNGTQGLALGGGAVSNRVSANLFVGNGAASDPGDADISVEAGANHNLIVGNRLRRDPPACITTVAAVSHDMLDFAAGQDLPTNMVGRWLTVLGGPSAGERRPISDFDPIKRAVRVKTAFPTLVAGCIVQIGGSLRPRHAIRIERGAQQNRLESNDMDGRQDATMDLGASTDFY